MYVIWTERKNGSDVLTKLEELFTGANVIPGHAYYKGVFESSLRIEIFDDKRPNFAKRVYGFAQWIAQHNNQESVAVQRQDDPELVRNGDYDEDGNWTGRALPSVIRNEFGIEQLDEPEGVYAKTPAVELPPTDSSDFENPFGAIDGL